MNFKGKPLKYETKVAKTKEGNTMKKRLAAMALAGIMAFSLMACGGKTETKEEAGNSSTEAEQQESSSTETGDNSDINISVILHALNGSFYTKMEDGARAAAEDFGCNVQVSAPNTASSLQEQVGLLETAIASDTDAIATVTWDPTGFNNVIKDAEEAGIPVVGFNQDAADCGTKAFIGQDYETAGYELGKYIFDEMGGKGSYIVASCGPTDVALVAREAGIDRAAEEFGGDVTKLETIDIGTDLTNAYSVIENAYLANPDVKAIVGVDCYSEAIGSVIEEYELSGKVYAAGFDLTEGMLGHIKNGSVQVTCGQNPFLQGYYAVMECYMNQKYGSQFLNLDTGAQMVDADNVDEVEPE